MTWTMKLCVPLASAAILVGCTQEVDTDPDQNRTPIDHATNQPRQNLQVSLTGCLGTGPGTNQYVLTQVKPAPLGSQPSDAMSSANLDFSQTTAVRLASNDEQELTSLVGQTVSVIGVLRDDGRNTIGTSGDSQQPAAGAQVPRTDKSQAATQQPHSEKVREEAGPMGNRSMNNGTYPEIMLREVTQTGEKCQPNPTPDRR